MSIFFNCSCGQQLTVRADLVGTRVVCPACLGVQTVPVPATDVPETIRSADEEPDDIAPKGVGFASAGLADVGTFNGPAGTSGSAFGNLGVIALRDPPTCLAYSTNDRWGAAGIDVDVQILDLRGHQRAYKIDRHEKSVTALRFSPDGRLLLSGDASGRILVWDLVEKRPIRWLNGHERKVVAIDVSSDGTYAASAARGVDVRAWNLETGSEIRLDTRQWKTEANCIAFAPSDLSFAAGGKNGDVDVWDLLTGEPLERPPTASREVLSLSFSRDGESLTGSGIGPAVDRNQAWRWRIPSGTSIDCWEGGGKGDCKESLNEVFAGGKRIVSIGEVPRKPPPNMPPPQIGGLVGAAVSAWQLYQLAKQHMPNDEHRVQVWNVKLGRRVSSDLFKGPRPTCLAVSPSGLRLIFGYGDHGKGRVMIWGIRP